MRTPLVARLTTCANYVDNMKTSNGLSLFEEGSQKLFREAAAALVDAQTEVRTLRDLLDVIVARDDFNSSLPVWYRREIDAVLAGLKPTPSPSNAS